LVNVGASQGLYDTFPVGAKGNAMASAFQNGSYFWYSTTKGANANWYIYRYDISES